MGLIGLSKCEGCNQASNPPIHKVVENQSDTTLATVRLKDLVYENKVWGAEGQDNLRLG